jgi:DNA polymerase (family 10)
LDNLAIARVLREIADLLEIKDENPFKIRAYRNGADIAANHPHQFAALTEPQLREIPGIGKDLALKIREMVETGDTAYHRELMAEFPPTILDLMNLQGVGPKTVATLYRQLGIRSLEDLEQAAQDGRIRALRGMGAKKEALIIKALAERKTFAGRRLMSVAHEASAALIAHLKERVPEATLDAVGSVRRGCETCGDVDLLASGAPAAVMDAFVEFPLVERILAKGDTKSSVLLTGGFQSDLRLVAADSRGAALQYFTGSKSHNIALRDRAIGRGFKLNEYGLYRLADDVRVAGEREEDIYRELGLDWVPPELRELRGELEAAESHALPALVTLSDIRGDIHMHSTASDGKDEIRAMAEAARESGLEYIAITDHSQSLAMANGLDEERLLAHAARIRAIDAEGLGIRILAGVECDILADGSLDLEDDCLAALDLVVASVHSGFQQDEKQMTDRLLRAIEHPSVDVLGHPTGRKILKRPPYSVDVPTILDAAAKHGVAVEINCQIQRLDLNEVHARLAHERGVRMVISSDAHSTRALATKQWGVLIARRAWLGPDDLLNTRPFAAFRASLKRNRSRRP